MFLITLNACGVQRNPTLHKEKLFDGNKDLTCIGNIATMMYVIVSPFLQLLLQLKMIV